MVLLEHVLYYSIIENYFHRVLLIRPEAAEASKIWGTILFNRLSLSASVLFSIPQKPWIWIPSHNPRQRLPQGERVHPKGSKLPEMKIFYPGVFEVAEVAEVKQPRNSK